LFDARTNLVSTTTVIVFPPTPMHTMMGTNTLWIQNLVDSRNKADGSSLASSIVESANTPHQFLFSRMSTRRAYATQQNRTLLSKSRNVTLGRQIELKIRQERCLAEVVYGVQLLKLNLLYSSRTVYSRQKQIIWDYFWDIFEKVVNLSLDDPRSQRHPDSTSTHLFFVGTALSRQSRPIRISP
jgi:hypothetical protein